MKGWMGIPNSEFRILTLTKLPGLQPPHLGDLLRLNYPGFSLRISVICCV